MKKIKLSQGKFALVDNNKFKTVNKFKWSYSYYGYAYRSIKSDGIWKHELMHRKLLGLHDPRIHVDHINGNRADNRLLNLRICTRSQNLANRGKTIKNTSGYKGVVYHNDGKRKKPWIAQIGFMGSHLFIGNYRTAREAAIAYNKQAKKLHGKFAYLNKV